MVTEKCKDFTWTEGVLFNVFTLGYYGHGLTSTANEIKTQFTLSSDDVTKLPFSLSDEKFVVIEPTNTKDVKFVLSKYNSLRYTS